MDEKDDETLNRFYLTAFPQAQRIEFCGGMNDQCRGIDKIVHFNNGCMVTIDEKKRRRDYGDILLELYKNHEQRKPGWLFYSQCDYIVYAILDSRRIYLLPVLLLQTAWHRNREAWLEAYPTKAARNKTYTTLNIPIPTEVLLGAIKEEMERSCGTA